MQSKEHMVIELFYNSPRHWHFEELKEKSGLSRSRLSFWLKRLEKQGMIIKAREKGRMPYYKSSETCEFRSQKRLFALKKVTDSGLMSYVSRNPGIKLAIVFGSFSRSDWYEDSDIDLFVYGTEPDFDLAMIGRKIGRKFHIFSAKSQEDLKRIAHLLPFILEGYMVKGSLEDVGLYGRIKGCI